MGQDRKRKASHWSETMVSKHCHSVYIAPRVLHNSAFMCNEIAKIPTSLTCCLFVINARGKAQHLGIQLPACCDLEETKM